MLNAWNKATIKFIFSKILKVNIILKYINTILQNSGYFGNHIVWHT